MFVGDVSKTDDLVKADDAESPVLQRESWSRDVCLENLRTLRLPPGCGGIRIQPDAPGIPYEQVGEPNALLLSFVIVRGVDDEFVVHCRKIPCQDDEDDDEGQREFDDMGKTSLIIPECPLHPSRSTRIPPPQSQELPCRSSHPFHDRLIPDQLY